MNPTSAFEEIEARLGNLELGAARSSTGALLSVAVIGLMIWVLARRIDALERRARAPDRGVYAAHDRALRLEVRAKALEEKLEQFQGEHAGLEAVVRNSLHGQAIREQRSAWRKFLDR